MQLKPDPLGAGSRDLFRGTRDTGTARSVSRNASDEYDSRDFSLLESGDGVPNGRSGVPTLSLGGLDKCLNLLESVLPTPARVYQIAGRVCTCSGGGGNRTRVRDDKEE